MNTPEAPEAVDLPNGFLAAAATAGLKKNRTLDLALVVSETPAHAAAVFTKNRFAAAPVQHGRALLKAHADSIRGVVVNSGCANACTGSPGLTNAERTAHVVEHAAGLPSKSLFVMSTGVIGVHLPVEKIARVARELVLSLVPHGLPQAASAILTTDTHPKMSTRAMALGGVPVRITGIAKGSGMIHPDMATMLGILMTDAAVPVPLLQEMLQRAVDKSFHCISVDGDTSTNDTVLLLANGCAGNAPIRAEDGNHDLFEEQLHKVCVELARAIAEDGEGATKRVTIEVNGTATDAAARRIGRTIATSPLVKTAFFGGDANWGRMVAAAGRAGVDFDPDAVCLAIAGSGTSNSFGSRLVLVEHGVPSAYCEDTAQEIFSRPFILVRLWVGEGPGTATVWTCDLSSEYVTINGCYRT